MLKFSKAHGAVVGVLAMETFQFVYSDRLGAAVAEVGRCRFSVLSCRRLGICVCIALSLDLSISLFHLQSVFYLHITTVSSLFHLP